MTKNVGSMGASEGSLFLGSVQRGEGCGEQGLSASQSAGSHSNRGSCCLEQSTPSPLDHGKGPSHQGLRRILSNETVY